MNSTPSAALGAPDRIAAKILELKEKRDAIILAHNYQAGEVQDIADFVGDSLDLSIKASQTDAGVIVFCGVHFMAETASLLCPDKIVLLPDEQAGCPMAEMVTAADLREAKRKSPGRRRRLLREHLRCSQGRMRYMLHVGQCAQVINSLPGEVPILFVPDRYLGAWVSAQTGQGDDSLARLLPTHQFIRGR